MAFRLADLFVSIGAQTAPLTTALANVKTRLLGFGSVGLQAGKNLALNIASGIAANLPAIAGAALGFAGFGGLGAAAGALAGMGGLIGGITAVVALGAAAVMGLSHAALEAGHLEEAINKAELVFGSMVTKVIAGADEMATRFGIVRRTFLDTSAAIGLMLEGAGFNQKLVTDMSMELTKLAVDAKSAFDVPMEVAVRKIEAGLAGMSRPLREWGIDLTIAHTKQKALALGIWNGKGEMDNAAKVLTRYKILTEGLKVAVGDLANSQGRITQQWEGMTGRLTNLTATIGSAFAPAFAKLLQMINVGLAVIQTTFDSIGDSFKSVMEWLGVANAEDATQARRAGIDKRLAEQEANFAADEAAAGAAGHGKEKVWRGGLEEFRRRLEVAAGGGGKDDVAKRQLVEQQKATMYLEKIATGRAPVPLVGVAG